ncbi:MAG: TetR family transcriptional regulator, partial [Pseudomonadota bacterium]
PTKEKLLGAARDLFWTRGYSNVSVRDITGAAGVDAALVSRYFGGKRGLFEATLAEIPSWSALDVDNAQVLTEAVASFSHPFDPATEEANAFTMLLSNIIDPEMGNRIRDLVQTALAEPLAAKLGGPHAGDRAAMILAALFGLALMRKNFQLEALKDLSLEETAARVAHLVDAANRFEG